MRVKKMVQSRLSSGIFLSLKKNNKTVRVLLPGQIPVSKKVYILRFVAQCLIDIKKE